MEEQKQKQTQQQNVRKSSEPIFDAKKHRNPTVYLCGWNERGKQTKEGIKTVYKPFAKAFEQVMSKETLRAYKG